MQEKKCFGKGSVYVFLCGLGTLNRGVRCFLM